MDAAIAFESGGAWELWLVESNGTSLDFANPMSVLLAREPLGIVAGSFSTLADDPDSHVDLAVAFKTQSSVDVALFPGTGSGTFDPPCLYEISSQRMFDTVYSIEAEDFDGNGADDLMLFLHESAPVDDGAIAVFLNKSAGFILRPNQSVGAIVSAPKASLFAAATARAQGTVDFKVSKPLWGSLNVLVYDVTGRLVQKVPVPTEAGEHVVTWDGRTSTGSRAPIGVYFADFRVGSTRATQKFLLLR